MHLDCKRREHYLDRGEVGVALAFLRLGVGYLLSYLTLVAFVVTKYAEQVAGTDLLDRAGGDVR